MNETKVQASLSRIVAGISTECDAMDEIERDEPAEALH